MRKNIPINFQKSSFKHNSFLFSINYRMRLQTLRNKNLSTPSIIQNLQDFTSVYRKKIILWPSNQTNVSLSPINIHSHEITRNLLDQPKSRLVLVPLLRRCAASALPSRRIYATVPQERMTHPESLTSCSRRNRPPAGYRGCCDADGGDRRGSSRFRALARVWKVGESACNGWLFCSNRSGCFWEGSMRWFCFFPVYDSRGRCSIRGDENNEFIRQTQEFVMEKTLDFFLRKFVDFSVLEKLSNFLLLFIYSERVGNIVFLRVFRLRIYIIHWFDSFLW